jgi:peptidoglycan/xylan/chitin deacetylase (PgdA/CDA1 family)
MRARAVISFAVTVAAGPCACQASPAPPEPAAHAEPTTPERPASTITSAQLDGRAFPDHVLALTWDDGPDANTLALAEYLRSQRVSATFFVVDDWMAGRSADPGSGRGVFATGYEHVPILADLVRLGHRVGNHTLHHVLLTDVDPRVAELELGENQRRIDPLLTNELALFRAPGGAWSAGAARAIAGDPALARLTGPIRWDVDRKDWENSLSCRSDAPAAECERSSLTGHAQVKPRVTAERYLESIESAGHGIVLLHDRVGQVGSAYALEVARALLPELETRGYVFAAPVLAFSPLLLRTPPGGPPPERALAFTDIDGDGRADLCAKDAHGVSCARSIELAPSADEPTPRLAFGDAAPVGPGEARALEPLWPAAGRELFAGHGEWTAPADVDGDGRPDRCELRGEGIFCALSRGGSFGEASRWSNGDDWGPADAIPWRSSPLYWGTIRFGDLNGDGRADVCGRGPAGVVCALSTGHGFARATLWMQRGMTDGDGWTEASVARAASLQLADVNGDGRADLCAGSAAGVECGLAP